MSSVYYNAIQCQNECTKVQNIRYKDVTLCLLYSIVLLCINYTLHIPLCIINSVIHASSYYATEEDN